MLTAVTLPGNYLATSGWRFIPIGINGEILGVSENPKDLESGQC